MIIYFYYYVIKSKFYLNMHINNIYCDIKLLYNTSINCFYSKYNISYDYCFTITFW